MRTYPIPTNEPARLRALSETCGLSERTHPRLDQIVAVTRSVTGCPTALISMVDEHRQYFTARSGIDVAETPREASICAYVIMSDEDTIITDAHRDPRFIDHPIVTGPPYIRFYAGTPIKLSSGFRVGSLCAVDYGPRPAPSPETMEMLRDLSWEAAAVLEGRAMPATLRAAANGNGRRDPNPTVRMRRPASLSTASSDAQGKYLSLVEDEFRAPLALIYGYAALLAKHGDNSPEASLAAGLMSAVEHLRSIVENVVRFSDLATGERQLDETEIDVDALFADVAKIVASSADAAGKHLIVESIGRHGVLLGDKAKLELALSSLIATAIAEGGHTIYLSATHEDGESFNLKVCDVGARRAATGSRRARGLSGSFDRPIFSPASSAFDLSPRLSETIARLHGGEAHVQRENAAVCAQLQLPIWRWRDGAEAA